jgi:hypothetical protein
MEQTKILNYASGLPRKGAVKFIAWQQTGSIGQNGVLNLALPEVKNGQILTFQIYNAVYQDPTHYSIYASGSEGYLSLFITPQGKGGTIDLITRTFTILPVEVTKSVIFENEQIKDEPNCGINSTSEPRGEADYCEGDCGAAIVDVLLLRTPQANTWLTTNWGWLSEWFLFVESHNINAAFANSDIPNKRVRFHSVNYTPNFAWSTLTNPLLQIEADVNAVSNSTTAQNLANQYHADIVVLLTNNNYGPFVGIVNNNALDPMANNMFAITQVANIDPSRYTLAHELAHHFGCRHSNPLLGGCPHGRNMDNGRNTIMANNAPNNTRIPYFSNPDVAFAGEPTGEEGMRDNAQQIRAAFCEVANNNPDPIFSVSFVKAIGPVCPGEILSFNSTVIPGDCPDPFGIVAAPNCGTPPYQYEWRVSTTPAFLSSQVVGIQPNLNLNVLQSFCSPFYVRLTVTSSNGLVATTTNSYTCSPGVACNRSATTIEYDAYKIAPNPAYNKILLSGPIDEITNIECISIQGNILPISYRKEDRGMAPIEVDLGNLPKGLYFLKVTGKNAPSTIKVILN